MKEIVNCTECGLAIPYIGSHRLEVQVNGRSKELPLCVSCCPNCFGGVGRVSHDPNP